MSNDKTTVVIANVRFIYPHVFEPSSATLADGKKSDPRYKTRFIVGKGDSSSLDELRNAIGEVVSTKYPDAEFDAVQDAIDEAVKDGDDLHASKKAIGKKADDYLLGAYTLSAASQFQPGIAGPDGKPIVNPAHFYSGCYGHLEVTLNPYADDKNRLRCSLWLNFVMKTKDADKIGGGQRAAGDVFRNVLPQQSAADPRNTWKK